MLQSIRFDYGHSDCMSFQPRNKHRLLRSARPLGSAPHARVSARINPRPRDPAPSVLTLSHGCAADSRRHEILRSSSRICRDRLSGLTALACFSLPTCISPGTRGR
jgi:hypothetical protein